MASRDYTYCIKECEDMSCKHNKKHIFDEDLKFEAIDEAGFRFGNENKMFFIPCYSEQNGYYTSDIDIFYNGNMVLNFCCEERFC